MIVNIIAAIAFLFAAICVLDIYRRTRIYPSAIFAAFPALLGTWQVLLIAANYLVIPELAKLSYVIGMLGMIAVFVFGEQIYRRFSLFEVLLAGSFGAFLVSLSFDALTYEPFSDNLLAYFGYGFSDMSAMLGILITTIVGIWTGMVSIKMVQKARVTGRSDIIAAAWLFGFGLVAGFFFTTMFQMMSIFDRNFQVFGPIASALGPLFVVFALRKYPYVPYLLPVRVEAITVYHTSGLPVYHRNLSTKITHDEALLAAAISAISTFTSEAIAKSPLKSVELGHYVLEHAAYGEYAVVLVALSHNEVIRTVLRSFIQRVNETLKDVNPNTDEGFKIISRTFEDEMPILVEMAPPERIRE
jgi:hypothetical protein